MYRYFCQDDWSIGSNLYNTLVFKCFHTNPLYWSQLTGVFNSGNCSDIIKSLHNKADRFGRVGVCVYVCVFP